MAKPLWGMELTTSWVRAVKRWMALPVLAPTIQKRVLFRIARIAGPALQKKIRAGGDPTRALSPLTISLKGSGIPLVDSGRLLAGAAVSVDGEGVTLGWPNDPEAGRVAGIMESGVFTKVTPAMRRLFAARGVPLRKTTVVLVVPPRPILGPAVDEVLEAIPQITEEETDRLLRRVGLL